MEEHFRRSFVSDDFDLIFDVIPYLLLGLMPLEVSINSYLTVPYLTFMYSLWVDCMYVQFNSWPDVDFHIID